MKIYTGASLAEQLTFFGTPTEFVSIDIAPQLLTYHFNLLNFNCLSRLDKDLKKLEMITHAPITRTTSTIGHFALILPREEREVIETLCLQNDTPLSINFGKDTTSNILNAKLQDMPHLLVAGTTGSGKSVALNSYIADLICTNTPSKLGLVLIDLKRCEFNIFDRLPHLMCDIVNDSDTAENTLLWLVAEMERRYKIMAEQHADKNDGLFKPIVLVVDELADLILQNENCRTLLIKLLQKARACDIHVIVATQSPRAKYLDGLMLANLPSRVCLTCSNVRESMLVLGHKGGEQLTGKGDCIIKLNGSTTEYRVQTPFISKQEIEKLLKE